MGQNVAAPGRVQSQAVSLSESGLSAKLLPVGGLRRWRDWYLAPKGIQSISGSWCLRDGDTPIFHLTHLGILGLERSSVRLDRIDSWGSVSLRPHQISGVEFCLSRRASLIADGMRVGKTLLACAIVGEAIKAGGPVWICAPLSTRGVWQRWLRAGGLEPYILEGWSRQPEELRREPLVLTHPQVLAKHRVVSVEPELFVYDEAHGLTGHKNLTTTSAALYCSSANRVLFLTGTPLWNKLSDFFTVLNLLTPKAWGSYEEYVRHFCDGELSAYGWVARGVSNAPEFVLRLRELMIRRTLGDVGQTLKVDRQTHVVRLSDVERQAVDDAIEAGRGATAKRGASAVIGKLAKARLVVGLLKVPKAADLVRVGCRDVFWCWHNEVASALKKEFKSKHGISALTVTGSTSEAKRAVIFDEWRTSEPRPLIITIGVGQVGIDLSAADRSVFVEWDWTPATVAQAEMRTFSEVRPSGMHVEYICAEHDIDERMLEALTRKLSVSREVGLPAADSAIDEAAASFLDLGDGDGSADMNRLAASILGYAI